MIAHLRFACQAYALSIIYYDNQILAGDVLTVFPVVRTGIFTPASVGNIWLSNIKI